LSTQQDGEVPGFLVVFNISPDPDPLPLEEGAWPSEAPLDSFSLREKVAEGRMRVKT